MLYRFKFGSVWLSQRQWSQSVGNVELFVYMFKQPVRGVEE